jgi:peroxiredoxin
MALKVGDVAPDFILKDNHGKEAGLGEFRGKKVVLGFHPLAWTRVCGEQMQDLEAGAERFAKADAVAFGLSIDSTFCKKAWAESLGVSRTRLLSDFWPHGDVAGKYGIFNDEVGASKRATVIVDEKGIVRWMKIYPTPERPNINEIMEEVEKI